MDPADPVEWLPLDVTPGDEVRTLGDVIRGEDATLAAGKRVLHASTLDFLGVGIWVGDRPSVRHGVQTEARDCVFNPQWVRRPVYNVVREEAAAATNGWMSDETVRRLLAKQADGSNRPLTDRQVNALLTLLMTCHLAFAAKSAGGDPGYIVPDVLPAAGPQQLAKQQAEMAAAGAAESRITVAFLPERVFLRFFAQRFGQIDAAENLVGRDAVRLTVRYAAGVDVSLLVQSVICPGDGAQPYLSLLAQSPDADAVKYVLKVAEDDLQTILREELGQEGVADRPLVAMRNRPTDADRLDRSFDKPGVEPDGVDKPGDSRPTDTAPHYKSTEVIAFRVIDCRDIEISLDGGRKVTVTQRQRGGRQRLLTLLLENDRQAVALEIVGKEIPASKAAKETTRSETGEAARHADLEMKRIQKLVERTNRLLSELKLPYVVESNDAARTVSLRQIERPDVLAVPTD